MGNEINFSNQMNAEEILMLLGQVYLNDLEIILFTREKPEPYTGKIIDIEDLKIYFRANNSTVTKIDCKDIIRLKLLEENHE